MSWRLVGGALGAVALAASVVVLRAQVAPPEPAAVSAGQPAGAETADPGLPVQDPVRPPRWRIYMPRVRAMHGIVGLEYLTTVRSERSQALINLVRRDTNEQVLEYNVPMDQAPWDSLLHDGMLLVSHGGNVVLIDPTTGLRRQLPPPEGHAFGHELVAVGSEVLVVGRQNGQPRRCMLAVQPRSGVARVVWCAPPRTTLGWLYGAAGEVVWPVFSDPPTGCPVWHRLRPGEQVQPMTPLTPVCGARELLEVGGWQVVLQPQRDATRPLIIATSGSQRLVLGSAPSVVACGRHVYWSASADDAVAGAAVYRWWPGAAHREVVYRLEPTSRRGLSAPRCTEGVLSVGVTMGSGPRVAELRALNRP